jgi:hypothetical protein
VATQGAGAAGGNDDYGFMSMDPAQGYGAPQQYAAGGQFGGNPMYSQNIAQAELEEDYTNEPPLLEGSGVVALPLCCCTVSMRRRLASLPRPGWRTAAAERLSAVLLVG